MVVDCWGPRQQGRTSSSDYVTPVTAVPVWLHPRLPWQPAAGRHPSRGIPVSLFPFLDAYARGLQGYRRNTPLVPLARSLARAIVALPAVPRPPKPTSLAANPSVNDGALPLRESTRKTTAAPALAPAAPFLRSHGHHFRWEVLRGRWGARADAARGGVRPR